jgi:hypothetical protein
MNKLKNKQATYAQLLKLAEETTSRKEARHLINEATRLLSEERVPLGSQ